MFSENHLTLVDYFVVGITLFVPVLIGVYHGFKGKHTTEDVLIGSRGMSTLPVAASIMVTFFSAISILGFPSEVYVYGIQIVMISAVMGIFAPISAYLFVPVLYNLELTSSFEYMEHRFDSEFVRKLTSATFLLYSIVLQSIVIYAPSIALQSIIGIPMWISIVVLGAICTIYTTMGGFKAVIWTDFFQLIILMIGMFAIMIRAIILSGGFVQTFKIAADNGRLNFFDFTIDPFMRHNFFNFVFGYGFKTMLTIATHQNQVQRYSSVPTQKEAIRSIIWSLPFNIGSTMLIGVTGLAIYAAYSTCDPIREGKLTKADQIVPYFVIQHLGVVPGILGLFLSCIFCAVLSTFSSGLNCMAAVLWEDFLSEISLCKDLKPKTKAHLSRGLALLFGMFSIGLAFLGPKLGSVLTITLSAAGAFTGPMAAVFVLGIFVPFANKFGATFGLLIGLCSTFLIVVKSFFMKKISYALPTSIEGCTNITSSFDILFPSNDIVNIEWPENFFTLSYLLYPTLGAIMTVSTGILISLCTGGLSTVKNVKSIYVHPCLHSKFKVKRVPSKRQSSIHIRPSLDMELDALMKSKAMNAGRFSIKRVSDGEVLF